MLNIWNIFLQVALAFCRVCFWLYYAFGPLWLVACIFGHGLLALLAWHCCTLIIVYVRADNATWPDWRPCQVQGFIKNGAQTMASWALGPKHLAASPTKEPFVFLQSRGECKNPAPDAFEINLDTRLGLFSNYIWFFFLCRCSWCRAWVSGTEQLTLRNRHCRLFNARWYVWP